MFDGPLLALGNVSLTHVVEAVLSPLRPRARVCARYAGPRPRVSRTRSAGCASRAALKCCDGTRLDCLGHRCLAYLTPHRSSSCPACPSSSAQPRRSTSSAGAKSGAELCASLAACEFEQGLRRAAQPCWTAVLVSKGASYLSIPNEVGRRGR